MAKEKHDLVQMRVYLPSAEIDRLVRSATARGVSLPALITELLSENHRGPMSSISLPASRSDWRVLSPRVPRQLYEALQARAAKLDARPWDLISAILLAAIPKR